MTKTSMKITGSSPNIFERHPCDASIYVRIIYYIPILSYCTKMRKYLRTLFRNKQLIILTIGVNNGIPFTSIRQWKN